MNVWIIMHDDGEAGCWSSVREVVEDRPVDEALAQFVKRIEESGIHAGENVKPDLLPNGEWTHGDRWSRWLLTRRTVTPRKGTI